MSKIRALAILALTMLLSNIVFAASPYGQLLCSQSGYSCHRVRGGESWESLFPDFRQRDIVMRVNRTNLSIHEGDIIAVPEDLANATIMSISPLPVKIAAPGTKEVIVDLNQLAWGAYDAQGNLIHWGPASGGRGYCPDVSQPCYTTTGTFHIIRKQPANCVSSVFPLEWEGGAPMPFCMHFYNGFALHGSNSVPGYNASHGCVRMFVNDARWLNEKFASLGTKVIVEPYTQFTVSMNDGGLSY